MTTRSQGPSIFFFCKRCQLEVILANQPEYAGLFIVSCSSALSAVIALHKPAGLASTCRSQFCCHRACMRPSTCIAITSTCHLFRKTVLDFPSLALYYDYDYGREHFKPNFTSFLVVMQIWTPKIWCPLTFPNLAMMATLVNSNCELGEHFPCSYISRYCQIGMYHTVHT